MNKLAVDDRVQAAVVALRSGLVWFLQAPHSRLHIYRNSIWFLKKSKYM
jgi:hypothetical protein